MYMPPFRRIAQAFILASCFSLGMLTLAAQDLDTVTITGKVTDQNGAIVPGATVKATRDDTKLERTVVTDGDGKYKIIQLAPGKYKLTASANTFQTTNQTGIEFIAGRNAQIDLI